MRASCTPRWTPTGWSPRRCGRRSRRPARPGKTHQVPLHDPELPQPGRRDPLGSAAARDPRDLPARGHPRPRGQPLRPAAASTSEPPRALRADEAEGVIYLGSFSKTFAPGFRVGWALAPHAVREKLVLAAGVRDAVPAAVLARWPSRRTSPTHDWQGQIKQFRGDVPRAPRRDGRGAARPDARRLPVERPRRRLLRLAHPARRASTPRRCCRGR